MSDLKYIAARVKNQTVASELHTYDRTVAFPRSLIAADRNPSLLLSSVISMSAF